MLQPGAELDLAEEAIGPEGLGQLRMEHLQGDRTLVTEVMRQVDHVHPTAAELARCGSGCQRCLETIQSTGRSWGEVWPKVTTV